jgi:ClpP class serine protease
MPQSPKKELDKLGYGIQNMGLTTWMRVSEGRNLDNALVKDSIGQGRVWTGVDALSLGLVDTLGSLQDAIRFAIKKSKAKNYIIREYPRIISPIEEIMLALGYKEYEDEESNKLNALIKKIKMVYPGIPNSLLKSMQEASAILQRKGTYMYLPWYMEVK